MKLLLMGAGYVGVALLSALQNQYYEIIVTTTREERVEELRAFGKQVVVIPPDEDKILQDLVDTCDGIVILVAPKNSQNYEETYLKTAKRVTSALKGRKTPFYILYTSSTSVCEGAEPEWVTEETPLSPSSKNAILLLETERLYLSSNADTCILRLGGIYGPKRELIERTRRLSGQEMTGTGDEPTNHIHLEDIVSAIAFCLERRLTGIYHGVNDDHTTRKELYSTLCDTIGLPPPKWSLAAPSEENKRGYKVSNQKIKEAGFIFKHPTLKK